MLYMALTSDEDCVIAIARLREKGQTIAYEITVDGAGGAVYERKPLDADGEPIACEVKKCRLDDLRYDQSHPPIVVWLARGIGGIPRALYPKL